MQVTLNSITVLIFIRKYIYIYIYTQKGGKDEKKHCMILYRLELNEIHNLIGIKFQNGNSDFDPKAYQN